MIIMADEMLRSCERKRLADKCHCSKVESKVINVFIFLQQFLLFALFLVPLLCCSLHSNVCSNCIYLIVFLIPSTATKPEGCCMWKMVEGKMKDISTDTAEIEVGIGKFKY